MSHPVHVAAQTPSASQYRQRRTFRGRGGPTDRRLAKHNAARRRPHPPPSLTGHQQGQEHQQEQDISISIVDLGANQAVEQVEQDLVNNLSLLLVSDKSDDEEKEEEQPEEEQAALEKELNHLHTRIRNNRTAMSLSQTALANPAAYQTNVLAACQNTVAEWRSILKHYFCRVLLLLDVDTVRSTGQAIFELIQQSLQCGPLAGSQPGYFKRCGSETAQLVYDYLVTILVVENNNTVEEKDQDAIRKRLGFTEKQAAAVATWKRNAQKAADKGQPPSKSILQNQDKAAAAKDRKKKTKKR